MTVSFYFESAIKLEKRRLLKQFLEKIAFSEKATISSADIIFCTDDYLLAINKKFLKHNYYTDIITFDFKANRFEPSEGEIYISVDRVKENALSYSVSIRQELHRVIFHGILHLCGYKDKSTKQRAIMRERENHYLNRYKKYVSRETFDSVPRGTRPRNG